MPSRVEIRDLLESMGVEFDRSLRKKELQAILDRVVEEQGSPPPRASRARTRAEATKEAEEQTVRSLRILPTFQNLYARPWRKWH